MHSILCKWHGLSGFYKLTTVPWDICSTSERMLGNIMPMHSCLLNGRRSRKTKHGLQYLWRVFRHVGMWCWVLSTLFASLLILTYIMCDNKNHQMSGVKSLRENLVSPLTWASSTQTYAPNHQITGTLQGREKEREREICQALRKSLLVIFTKVLRYVPVGIYAAEGNSVSKWKIKQI